jgi:hypothetical protein
MSELIPADSEQPLMFFSIKERLDGSLRITLDYVRRFLLKVKLWYVYAEEHLNFLVAIYCIQCSLSKLTSKECIYDTKKVDAKIWILSI